MDHLINFVLRNTAKKIGEQGINWGSETLLNLDYADNLNILDEGVPKYIN